MNPSQSLFTKYQLPLFFLLSYLLSWWAILPLQGNLAHGVAIAAAIVVALTLGRTGLREWWGRLTNFRAGWWFLVGPAIIVGYYLVAAMIVLPALVIWGIVSVARRVRRRRNANQ
jgi:hypothetical protein